jgi:hypothetical protein
MLLKGASSYLCGHGRSAGQPTAKSLGSGIFQHGRYGGIGTRGAGCDSGSGGGVGGGHAWWLVRTENVGCLTSGQPEGRGRNLT